MSNLKFLAEQKARRLTNSDFTGIISYVYHDNYLEIRYWNKTDFTSKEVKYYDLFKN